MSKNLQTNLSHISRAEAIKRKEQSLQEEFNVLVEKNSPLAEASKILAQYREKNPDDANTAALEGLIKDTIRLTKAHLVSKAVVIEGSVGFRLFQVDLLRRATSEDFKKQIPNYLEKFISYVSYIGALDVEMQKVFLEQFPPDNDREYACDDGAKSRLEAVYESAKPSAIIVKVHNLTVEEIAIEFRKSVYQGNRPHVAPFVNYLLGIDKSLVVKDDSSYSTPNTDISTSAAFEAIEGYERSLLSSYLELVKGAKEELIKKIIKITQEDNANAGEYRGEEIKKLLRESLDIDKDAAANFVLKISEQNEIAGSDDKYTFWKFLDKVSGEKNIAETLEELITKIISDKSEYIDEINAKQKAESLSSEVLTYEKLNDIIAATSTILEDENKRVLTQKEKSGIYALRVLGEKLQDSSPIQFLVASDHFEGKKEALLVAVSGDAVLTRYIERIFEVRENFLGSKNAKVSELHPVFYAILTKNEQMFSDILNGLSDGEIEKMSEEIFAPKNQPDERGTKMSELVFAVNSFELTTLFINRLSKNRDLLQKILNIEYSQDNILNYLVANDKDKVLAALLRNDNITQNPQLFERFLNAKSAGRNGFILAVEVGKIEMVKLFLDPAIFKVTLRNIDSSGSAVLALAVQNGDTEMVKLLLESPTTTSDPELFKEMLSSLSRTDAYPENPFAVAVKRGHAETVKLLLDSDATTSDPEFFKKMLSCLSITGSSGKNPVAWAVAYGKTAMVKLLLDSDAITNDRELLKGMLSLTDSSGNNPFAVAVREGKTEILELLLKSPITKDRELFKEMLRSLSITPHYDINNAFTQAVIDGHIETVKLLLENLTIVKDVELVNIVLSSLSITNYSNPFPRVVRKGDTAMVKLLLEHPLIAKNVELVKTMLSSLSITDFSDNNPFAVAVIDGHIETVKLLLENLTIAEDVELVKIMVSSLSRTDAYPENPFAAAVNKGDIAMVKLLLDSGVITRDVEIFKKMLSSLSKSSFGKNTFTQAVIDGHTEMVKLLLNSDAIANDVELVNTMLSGLSLTDSSNNNPFFVAVRDDKPEMVKVFLNSRAITKDVFKGMLRSLLIITDPSGNNTFTQAVIDGHAETVKLLLNSDAITEDVGLVKIMLSSLSSADSSGSNVFTKAVKRGKAEMIKLFLESPAIAKDEKFFKRMLSSLGITDSSGNNPFALAVRDGKLEMVKVFLNSHAITKDVFKGMLRSLLSVTDSSGNNAFTLAFKNGHIEIVKLLLDSDAITKDPELFKEMLGSLRIVGAGDNVFTNALINGKTEMIELLLKSPVITNDAEFLKIMLNILSSPNSYFVGALAFAVSRGKTEMVKLFLDSHAIANDAELFKKMLHTICYYDVNSFALAVDNGYAEMVKLILDTPAITNDSELFEKLLKSKSYGNNVFASVVKNDKAEMVKLFLESPAITKNPKLFNDLLNGEDSQGLNPLNWARSIETAKILLEKGCIINNRDHSPILAEMCARSKANSKTLIRCVKSGTLDDLTNLIERLDPEELKEAINISVYIDTLNHKHRTPLQFAAQLGKADMMEVLIDKGGANVNVVNAKGRTAYDYAVKGNKTAAIEFLSEKNPPSTTVEDNTTAALLARNLENQMMY